MNYRGAASDQLQFLLTIKILSIMTTFIKFNNGDLSFDIQKIESFDAPITVAKSYEPTFDCPHALDVEDTSYWYAEEKKRDEDFEKLKSLVPRFSFVEL